MAKGLGNMMKMAQKIQSQIAKIHEEMAQKTVEVSSGGGMVTVIANGQQEIVSLKIEPEVIDSDDIEMMQDLITAAVNEALRKSRDMLSEEMNKVTGGLNIPGFPGLV